MTNPDSNENLFTDLVMALLFSFVVLLVSIFGLIFNIGVILYGYTKKLAGRLFRRKTRNIQ